MSAGLHTAIWDKVGPCVSRVSGAPVSRIVLITGSGSGAISPLFHHCFTIVFISYLPWLPVEYYCSGTISPHPWSPMTYSMPYITAKTWYSVGRESCFLLLFTIFQPYSSRWTFGRTVKEQCFSKLHMTDTFVGNVLSYPEGLHCGSCYQPLVWVSQTNSHSQCEKRLCLSYQPKPVNWHHFPKTLVLMHGLL